MTFRDIAAMCIKNLFRRKGRTMLTVLGVVIGCTAIVIMVSIGIGMKESQEKMLAEMGDLTLITVNRPHQKNTRAKFDTKTLNEIRRMPNVEVAALKKSLAAEQVKLFAGSDRRFVADAVPIVGMEIKSVDKLGYRLLDGQLAGIGRNGILVGQYVDYQFRDTMRPEGFDRVDRYANMMMGDDMGSDVSAQTTPEPPPAFLDTMQTPLTLEVKVADKKTVTYSLQPAARLKEDFAKGYESSEGLFLPLELLNEIEKAAGIPETAAEQTLVVKVKSIQDVADTESAIKRLGFQTSSMESIRKPLEKEAQQKQLMLGGLGAISLLVAAIGITNTMIMSISERTKEIGIMKALGCYVSDVRVLFLAEAGSIGFLGGLFGSGISLLISFIMNRFSVPAMSSDMMGPAPAGSSMSVIPYWLILFAIFFSIVIGLVSGYYPANKAVRISALEAIRSE